jgi:hypothetical protein
MYLTNGKLQKTLKNVIFVNFVKLCDFLKICSICQIHALGYNSMPEGIIAFYPEYNSVSTIRIRLRKVIKFLGLLNILN